MLRHLHKLASPALFARLPTHPRLPGATLSPFSASTGAVETREKIEKLVGASKVVVFMKGTPDAPKCGFSNAVMQILRMHGVKEFTAHNVLEDEQIRQGIKDYSSWPTIPQVYINGDFVGGCDIMIEMHQKGELVEELQKAGIRSALLDQPAPKPA